MTMHRLSGEERRALERVAQGWRVPDAMRQRLSNLGFLYRGLGGDQVTGVGRVALAIR